MDGNGVWRFPEGSGRQGRMERYCFNVICGAPTTSMVKGLRLDEMKTITGALGLLLWYCIVFKEHSRGLQVKISTTGALGRLCRYNRVL